MKNKIILFTLLFSFFTFHFSFSQSWLWGKCGIGYGLGNSVAANGSGDCYLSGYYYSDDTLNFSDSILINPPHNRYGVSFFLVKYNSMGVVQWVRQSVNYGNVNWVNGGTVALDNAGNIYMNATYYDTVFLGSYTFIFPRNMGTADFLVAKYGSNGDLRWASSPITQSSDTSAVASNSISADMNGNAFVTGIFWADTVSFGSTSMIGNRHIALFFLVKYDSTGNVQWAKSSGAGRSAYEYNNGEGLGVATDRNGNAYATGEFGDSIWFDSYELLTNQYSFGETFLVKYSPNGNVLWAKQGYIPSSSSGSTGTAVATDASGNIYLAGEFTDTVTFGAYTLISNPIYLDYLDFFLVKYDSNGTVLWAKQGQVLDSNSWGAGALSIDNDKHIYLSAGGGSYHCKVAFAGDTVSLFDTAKYDVASIVFKLDSNGNTLCSSIISGGGYDAINSISSDSSGNYVYFGSTTETPLIFGNDTINPFLNWNPTYGNYFPFAARWGECGEIVTKDKDVTNYSEGVKVYPNPNEGIFTLVCHSEQSEKSQQKIEIYNVLGENIYNAKVISENTQINLDGHPNGIYLYRVIKEDGSLVGEGKVIVEK